MSNLEDIWVYLAATPLIGLASTLLAYQGAYWLYRRGGMHPLPNPVLIAVCILVAGLTVTGTWYQTYFDSAQFVHLLLGPATVALAVPVHAQLGKRRRLFLPLLAGLLAGATTAVVSAVAVGFLLGGSRQTLVSLAPKSVTIPVAMGIAEKLGGCRP